MYVFAKSDTKFRPITILDPLLKLVTSVVMARLLRLLFDWKLLRPEQYGFVVGGSVDAALQMVAAAYEHASRARWSSTRPCST